MVKVKSGETVHELEARSSDVIALVDTPSFGEYVDFLAENPGCTYGFTVGGMKGKALLDDPVPITLCYPFATIFESALPPLMRSRFLPKGR